MLNSNNDILLIGFGSIGKRHYEVLNEFFNVNSIDIVTKQTLDDKVTYKSLDIIENLNQYDYFIIASETNKHYEQLKYLEDNVKNKLIFCEKPLFDTYKEFNIINNKVYVGYVLRFHPLLLKLKELVKAETIININAKCGQYLPTWRPGTDYTKSYSASKKQGGGVLLDLSHEIDYVQWFVGNITDIKSYQVKVSDLNIDSDDLTTFIGRSHNGAIVNISIDYISKITHRSLHIDTIDNSYILDFINNILSKKDKNGKEKIFNNSSLGRNDMFTDMHKSILNHENIITSYKQAQDIMKTIITIQDQNNG